MRIRLIFLLLLTVFAMAAGQSITQLEGTVELKESGSSVWLPVFSGDAFAVGSSLRSLQGEVVLENTLSLLPNSEITRTAQGYQLIQGIVEVEKDVVFAKLSSHIKVMGHARYEIEGPNAENPGDVYFGLYSGEARVTLGGRVFQVNALEQLYIPVNGEPERLVFDPISPVVAQGQAKVQAVSGSAEILLDNVWQLASIEDVVMQGQSVRTGAESWLELEFDDSNLIRLQADSEVSLEQIEDLANGTRRTKLNLLRGKLWSVVNTEGQPFEVETTGLVAGVRGTVFRVDSDNANDNALIKVFEGEVAGTTANDTVVLEEDIQFFAGEVPTNLMLDALDQFNIERDELLANNPPLMFDVNLPQGMSFTVDEQFTVSGHAEAGAELEVNGFRIPIDNQGQFVADLRLEKGQNSFVFNLKSRGQEKEQILTIFTFDQ